MVNLRLFASLIIILLIVPALAGNEITGTVNDAFLKLGCGVRAVSMGGAFTAVADDSTAISWNPAGIASLGSSEVAASYSLWLLDTGYSNIHYVKPIGPGVVGASIFYLSYGNISETTSTQRLGTGRTFTPSAYVAALAWGQPINEQLALGVAAKFLGQNIDSYGASGVALDTGLSYLLPAVGLKLGAVIQNVGGSLPQMIKVGAAKAFLSGRLNLSLDLDLPNDNKTYASLGGEFAILPQFIIRAGFNTKTEEGSGGNVALGLGLNLSRFAVDYGYVPFGDLGSAHRVGVRVGL